MEAYQLRCELAGHEEDVRGVIVCPLGIVTSSRDKSVRIWAETSDAGYQQKAVLLGHTDFVGPIAWLANASAFGMPESVIASGSRDKSIIIWDPESASLLYRLEGHKEQVSGLDMLDDGRFVSCALDRLIKVWEGDACAYDLAGHEGAVLCVLALPCGDLLSGSGDTTIRRWKGTQCTHILREHTDSVRSLAALPYGGFASASHDTTVRVWSSEGQCSTVLVGHSALVYSVSANSEGSEDNTVRLWNRAGLCLHVIDHPGCIWSLAFLANGDLATGCSDSLVRLWTNNRQRQAPDAVQEGYRESVAHYKNSSREESTVDASTSIPEGLKVEESSRLSVPGTRNGDTVFIRNNDGGVTAHSWNAVKFEWELIGQVVSGPDPKLTSAKKIYQGQEWDFVFDVDVEDGAPPRKLPMNIDENPYIVADRFLIDEDLPGYFREQVAQFIIQNTEKRGKTSALENSNVTGGFTDPFTGHNSEAREEAPKIRRQIPSSSYMLFDTAPPIAALTDKLRQFNNILGQTPETQSMALSDSDMMSGGALDTLLSKIPHIVDMNALSKASLSEGELRLTARLLQWPSDKRFPGLDLMRCIVLNDDAAQRISISAGNLDEPGQSGNLSSALSSSFAEDAPVATQQTALRLACNCFKHESLRDWLRKYVGSILDKCAVVSSSSSKGLRLQLATLFHNFTVLMTGPEGRKLYEEQTQLLSALTEIFDVFPQDEEDGIARTLIAVGTLLTCNKSMMSMALDVGVGDTLKRLSSHTSRRIQELTQEVRELLDNK